MMKGEMELTVVEMRDLEFIDNSLTLSFSLFSLSHSVFS